MSGFRRVTEAFWVSPQIGVEDVDAAKSQGFVSIINNRPDGEEAGQPSSNQIEAAARAAGLSYLYAPVVGRPSAQAVSAVEAAAGEGKTLAFCRSGTRSIITWALGEASRRPKAEIVTLGDAAGYDLRAIWG
jgi:uncharacterized protein (TIGR01244 family)